MKEHNTNFYSLENIKETLKSCDGFLDGEEVYYHIGALRYAYEEIERLNNIIDELENWLNIEIDRIEKMINPKKGINPYGKELEYLRIIKNSYIYAKNKLKELKGSDKDE